METYVVKWKGPYQIEELKNLSEKSVIYLVTGYQKSQKTLSKYFGITGRRIGSRMNDKGHKHNLIIREKQFWLGEVKSKKASRYDLELIESVLVYFWQCDLNHKKKVYPPEPTAIISCWYFKNDVLRQRTTHEAQKLDDVIFWDGKDWHLSQKMYVFQD